MGSVHKGMREYTVLGSVSLVQDYVYFVYMVGVKDLLAFHWGVQPLCIVGDQPWGGKWCLTRHGAKRMGTNPIHCHLPLRYVDLFPEDVTTLDEGPSGRWAGGVVPGGWLKQRKRLDYKRDRGVESASTSPREAWWGRGKKACFVNAPLEGWHPIPHI